MFEEFDKEDLEFCLPDEFKGLSKDYMLNCIFSEKIQKSWITPKVGDLIVTTTGNIFTISGEHYGTFFFGGFLQGRNSRILSESSTFVVNFTGELKRKINGKKTCSKFSEFRFIPYPHELKNII